MIYEFIATITAGFGMAGLGLIIRHLSKLAGKQTPKWLIPVFIGLGMLGFQIHQEYHWYEQTVAQLPNEVNVIKTVESSAWYKPWSYIRPQVSKFMAIDTKNIETNQLNNDLRMVNLYLFERRMSNQQKTQIIDCANIKRADYIATDDKNAKMLVKPDNQTHPPLSKPTLNLTWYPLSEDDPIIKVACQA